MHPKTLDLHFVNPISHGSLKIKTLTCNY